MAYSLMVIVSDGNLSEIPITIDYLEREHLTVTVNSAPLPSNGYSYVWSGANVITISPTVATGLEVRVVRTTPAGAAIHDFQAGAVFSELSVDENFTQDLYLLQEAKEQSLVTDIYNNLNMHGYKITNVAPAISSGDVPNLGQVAAMITGGAGTGNGIFFTTLVASAGQTSATLNVPVAPGTVPMLFLRGVYQQYGDSEAYVTDPLNPQRLLFNTPLAEGDSIQVIIMSGAESISKGNRTLFVFRNDSVVPVAPSDGSHAGWELYPTPSASGEVTYVCVADVDGSTGDLITPWSEPYRFTGAEGQPGIDGIDGDDGASVFDIEQVSNVGDVSTYRFALTNGSFTNTFQVLNGSSVQSIELVSKVGKVATYRFLLSNATYTNTFQVLDGLDGSGSVVSVNGVSPGGAGNVTLTAANVGAVNKTGDSMSGQLSLTPSFVDTSVYAQLAHIGKDATKPLYIRNMREHNSTFWLWEKVYSGSLYYSSGANGSGTNKIRLQVSGSGEIYLGENADKRVYHEGFKPTAADVGADSDGAATSAVVSHVALADPHAQYDYRWSNTTANTGEMSGSKRVRWLVDTSAARNRTIGSDVTDLLVKDATGQAGTKNITITAPAGKTINGATTEVIDADFGWVQYTLVGADFKTIGGQ